MERTYRIHMAAEMTGVSEGLIRAWERRYGVLKPRRTPSGYRAYTQSDIEVLRRLKKLTEEGVAIADAVRMLPQIKRAAKEHVEAMDAPRKPPQQDQFEKWRQEVLRAAERLDQQAIEAVLDDAMTCMPPVAFFDEVILPLQREVGDRWHAGDLTVAEEHLVTQAARQRVLTLLHQAPRRARRHVVLACFPTEDHELGLMGVALKFRHAGWRVTFLGARTPPEHLARVVKGVQPDVVALSAVSVDVETLRLALEQVMAALPLQTRVVLGGAAALAARDLVASSRASVIDTPDEWSGLLG